MKQRTSRAILLKRIDYGEADRILTVLTPNQGKLTLLAKGVRRSKSKLAGGLELFSVTNVTYIDGKSDMKTIIGTQLENFYSAIPENIDKTMVAYEFLKKIHLTTEEEADESYFHLLETALSSLHKGEVSVEHVEAWFYMHLLEVSGHGINLEYDASGSEFEEETMYEFSYDDMSFYSNDRGQFDPKHIKLLRLLRKVSQPELLLRVQGSEEMISSLLTLLKRCNS